MWQWALAVCELVELTGLEEYGMCGGSPVEKQGINQVC